MALTRWLSAIVACWLWAAPSAPAQEVKAGKPIEYRPFFPDKWTEFKQPTRLYPWEGRRVVLLTTRDDFDGKTMAVFLDRLDAGWDLYDDLVGRKPVPFRELNGKATVAAVPEAKFTCGLGCGFVGSTGIEAAAFYKDFFGGPGDYDLVRKDPEAFAHYYFYEMGRNYFLFGDRHGVFTTGFAVFMRNVCMDTLKCKDPDRATRDTIDRAEALYAASKLTYAEAFIESKGLRDGGGKPITPTDANVMYASVMLKLRKDHGGNEWVRRFNRHLIGCPTSPASEPGGAAGQALNLVVAASLAAGRDLSADFRDRWRFPFAPDLWGALGKVDWGAKGLAADDVYSSIPSDLLPESLRLRCPGFLTAEVRKRNLVVGGRFEEGEGGEWRAQSNTGKKDYLSHSGDEFKEGKRSLAIRSPEPDDAFYIQKVKVVPGTRYLLAGWIKTKDVSGKGTANLSLLGEWTQTPPLAGTNDWTYAALTFDSEKRTEVEICARLGFYSNLTSGAAWFDDIVLVELGKSAPKK